MCAEGWGGFVVMERLGDEDGGGGSIYNGSTKEDAPAQDSGLSIFLALLPMIYIPCFLFNLAGSITDPVIPLLATHLGGNVATAGMAVSIDRLATIAFAVPAGL
eukprot:COSAG02_NODE_18478_length_936_cov_0.783751_1_plen_103_part_01